MQPPPPAPAVSLPGTTATNHSAGLEDGGGDSGEDSDSDASVEDPERSTETPFDEKAFIDKFVEALPELKEAFKKSGLEELFKLFGDRDFVAKFDGKLVEFFLIMMMDDASNKNLSLFDGMVKKLLATGALEDLGG